MQFFSDNFALVLGSWHPYKVATESIYYQNLDSFLGQAFHALFLNHKVRSKPRLSHLEFFFNQLVVSYPTFRDQLLELYSNCPAGHPFKTDIQNLHDLFEFFLPLVCYIFITQIHSFFPILFLFLKFLNAVDSSSIIREFFFENNKSRYAQTRLTDGDLVAGRAIQNEASIRAFQKELYAFLADLAITQSGGAAVKDFDTNLVVTLDVSGGRVTINSAPLQVGQLRIVIGTIEVNFGG